MRSWRAQVMGFGWLLVLFLACGLAFGPLTASAAGLRGFQTLYFISSFWAQFGPNATTFLVVRARRLGVVEFQTALRVCKLFAHLMFILS